MNLSVATNWDPELIDHLDGVDGVNEIFGVRQKTPVGSGRPYFIIADPDEAEIRRYIHNVHAGGKKFNYLLNGPCMNNLEYDKETHRQLIEHLCWLDEIGVDSVTVTIPYLVEIIKRQFSRMEVRISVIAHVNSVQRAKFFESLGADSITLDFNLNRDFKLLEKIRKAVNCRLTLIVNDACLYQCPFRYYHYNILAHSTQPYNPLGGFYIDYCIIRCTIEKFSHPAEIIKGRWIRPEDIPVYQDLGIDTFKISGRRMSTPWLHRAAKAYSQKTYHGNLFDLLNCVAPSVDPDVRSPQYQAFLEKTELLNREKLIQLGQLYPVKPFIHNSSLDGFIDFFKTRDCVSGCEDCTYCKKIAEKSIRLDINESGKYISALKELLTDLTTSRIFEDPEREGGDAVNRQAAWNTEIMEIFEAVIGKVPGVFRDIAGKTVKKRAECNARERNSPQVEEEDMVNAFLSETPAAFREQMIAGLEEKFINLRYYL